MQVSRAITKCTPPATHGNHSVVPVIWLLQSHATYSCSIYLANTQSK